MKCLFLFLLLSSSRCWCTELRRGCRIHWVCMRSVPTLQPSPPPVLPCRDTTRETKYAHNNYCCYVGATFQAILVWLIFIDVACRMPYIYIYICIYIYVYMHACWPSPIVVEVSIIFQLHGYQRGMGDHRVTQWWAGVISQWITCRTLITWSVFDHASHVPRLRSCNYDLCELVVLCRITINIDSITLYYCNVKCS